MTSSSPVARSSTYRPDLDGLRGVAIALVVIYHVFVGRVSGGVDIFLLLSGYFFLGSQLRYAGRRHASLNPWWPIWRTLRRLVPALAVVMFATLPLLYLFAPQMLTRELGGQVTAALLYHLNWELIGQEADYAAASADTSPLQHLWSMSVQGQFYLGAIVFALAFAWLVKRRSWTAEDVRTVAGPLLAVATLASFLWAARHGWIGTQGSYYSTFARSWELTLGALLALYLPLLKVPERIAGPLPGIGLVIVALTGLLIPTSLAFPGPAALLPLGGAVLVILGGGRGRVARMLASRPAIWLGDIAYSLYLWHWPLLIIGTAAVGATSPPWWLGTAVVAVSLLLADLTHRLVEAPLRQRTRRPTREDRPLAAARASLRRPAGALRAGGGLLVAGLAAALLAFPPAWSDYLDQLGERDMDPRLYPGARVLAGAPAFDAPPSPDPAVIAGIYPQPGHDSCMVFTPEAPDHYATTDRWGGPCIYGDPDAQRTVVIAGGSHAEPWTEPLDALGRQHGFQVIPFLRQECPIVLGDAPEVSRACAEWSAGAVRLMVSMAPDVVVSTSTRPVGPGGVGPDVAPAGYRHFWEALDDAGIPFIGLRDNPWTTTPAGEVDDPNYCMLRVRDGGAGCTSSTDPVSACSLPRTAVYAEEDPAAAVLADHRLAQAVDTADWFCTADACPPVIGNIPVMRDQNHISNAYALSAADLLWPHLERAFNLPRP
ncbi:acyltransferase family protein [Corynebacterium guangdongense]|uniref:Peptidoglycan/LPS O-acetylase OafA/YrhL n=1 Tax=Corynebacterium guangdongense TaxID=1783348 RepID=A0ABU1ZZF3_9CORY|nr:acyltransferase family protein [Corynebacterium guangdongense]MDR7329637.1 peptidoglycan/LPS O-acetylase OafA/YrhL [Corynebacterium guangdongense]WJZ18202.1 O-acetyltransferase OatA [Corynebacterium guangdongense]